jgi:lysophospholipase L1-like esterase
MRRFVLGLVLPLAACGGGGAASPIAASTAAPAQSHPVGVVVFYDENQNGVLDPSESVRLPNVIVAAAGQTARTQAGGVATLQVPAGSQLIAVAPESLPPFWQARQAVALVPQTSQVVIPATLPIGNNRPNTYMGFGDSITVGEGSSDGDGYQGRLESRLRAYFGRASLIDEGVSATRSDRGAARIADSLRRQRPAYVLIHYGTNDWNAAVCRNEFPCYTIDALREMVRATKQNGSLPFLATIIPTNTGYDPRVPLERNEWVELMDELIRQLASEEGAVLVDLERAFFRVPEIGTLFSDHVHPNDAGYEIIANTFFDAITRSRAASASVVY